MARVNFNVGDEVVAYGANWAEVRFGKVVGVEAHEHRIEFPDKSQLWLYEYEIESKSKWGPSCSLFKFVYNHLKTNKQAAVERLNKIEKSIYSLESEMAECVE